VTVGKVGALLHIYLCATRATATATTTTANKMSSDVNDRPET